MRRIAVGGRMADVSKNLKKRGSKRACFYGWGGRRKTRTRNLETLHSPSRNAEEKPPPENKLRPSSHIHSIPTARMQKVRPYVAFIKKEEGNENWRWDQLISRLKEESRIRTSRKTMQLIPHIELYSYARREDAHQFWTSSGT